MKSSNIWAYCRVSTRKAEQELSLEQQIGWAESFARQKGAKLTIFSERASAKTITSRAECVRMLQSLESAKPAERPELLLATSFDRLSRDITDTLILARSLRLAGVQLYVRDRGFIAMESFADQASIVGQAMGGHAENEARSNRIKASWQRRRLEGKPTSNKSPYGLQLQNERDIPEPESAPWVLQAFQWYVGGQGMPQIARRFQAGAPAHRVLTSRIGPDGTRVVRERHHVWEENRVRKLLEQRRYRGVLVEEALYDQVQELLRSKPKWRQQRNFEYPLSGAIKCASCGRSFHGHATGGAKRKKLANGAFSLYPNSKRFRYYTCTVCHYMINADQMELWFWSEMKCLAAHPSLVRKYFGEKKPKTAVSSRTELQSLNRELANLQTRRQRAWDIALDATGDTRSDLPEQLRRLSEQEGVIRDSIHRLESVDEHQETLARSIAGAKQLVADLRRLYDHAPYEQKRELCNAVVRALGGAVATKEGLVWLRDALPTRKHAASQESGVP